MKQARLWVDPAFKKKLKKEAADLNCSILDLTRRLAESEVPKFEKEKRLKLKFR